MNPKFLLKIFLTIALFAMVTSCGDGGTPDAPAQVASDDSAPAEAPVEAQAPAAGFTPSSKCIVPDVIGLDIAVAESSLAGAGLQPLKDFRHDESVAENAIISQDPAAGTTLEPCQGDVVIVISLGAVPVPTDTAGPTETPAPPTETPTPLPPTATPTPELVRVLEIEAPVGQITDASPSFLTRFWLDDAPITGSFLILTTGGVSYANPVWINENLVGITPNIPDAGFMLFVSASALHVGENELLIEAGADQGGNHDDHYVNQIRLDINQAQVPPNGEALEILIDPEIHHIGTQTINEWSVQEAENPSYIKFFELPQKPTRGAVLILKTFGVHRPNPIRINDNLIGNLPGHWRENWTNDVQIYISPNYLQAGANSLRIDSTKDDFMMQDIRLLIDKE